MLRRTTALLSLSLLTWGATTPTAHAGPTGAYERHAVRTVNDVRADHGLRALRRSDCLARMAGRHARRMAARQAVVHQDVAAVMRECRLSGAAENVAVGYRTGRAAVKAGFMVSETHRANILTRGHRLTAVGAHRDELGQWWVVQLLGRR